MTNLALAVGDIADCCSLPSWLESQGSARPPVQAQDSHISACTPVTRARMLYRLYSCTCQRASTDTMLGILQFTRCLLKNRRHTQPKKMVLSTCFVKYMTNLALAVGDMDCCSLPSWLESQGSGRHLVQGGYSHTSASTPVTRARRLRCNCPSASIHSSGN